MPSPSTPSPSIPSHGDESTCRALATSLSRTSLIGQLIMVGVRTGGVSAADVVPASVGSANQPIGALRRGYGSDPAVVARKVTAFVRGMASAGVATSVKHFPGLGRVRGNTDTEADVVDAQTVRHDPLLAAFSPGTAAGVGLVMISLATYSRIDPDRPAAFSSTVITGMLRGDLGFGGVVISDDLDAQAVSGYPAGERATRFLRAGGDLVLVGHSYLVPPMAAAISAAADRDPRFSATLVDSATRVLTLKARHGLAPCRS